MVTHFDLYQYILLFFIFYQLPCIKFFAAIASPVSPTSAAIKENWECRRCTLINLADASNCEACNLPKSAEHKYLGIMLPCFSLYVF